MFIRKACAALLLLCLLAASATAHSDTHYCRDAKKQCAYGCTGIVKFGCEDKGPNARSLSCSCASPSGGASSSSSSSSGRFQQRVLAQQWAGAGT